MDKKGYARNPSIMRNLHLNQLVMYGTNYLLIQPHVIFMFSKDSHLFSFPLI